MSLNPKQTLTTASIYLNRSIEVCQSPYKDTNITGMDEAIEALQVAEALIAVAKETLELKLKRAVELEYNLTTEQEK